jgi:hypothetical protein
MRKKPSSLVVPDTLFPPVRITVTVTPATAAPVVSVNVPSIVPVVDVCARVPGDNEVARPKNVTANKNEIN